MYNSLLDGQKIPYISYGCRLYRKLGSRESCGLGSTVAMLSTTQSVGNMTNVSARMFTVLILVVLHNNHWSHGLSKSTFWALFSKISICPIISLWYCITKQWTVLWEMPVYFKIACDSFALKNSTWHACIGNYGRLHDMWPSSPLVRVKSGPWQIPTQEKTHAVQCF